MGNASYSEATMLAGTIDGVSANEAAASATLGAIRAFLASRPTIYLPAHDPDAPPHRAAGDAYVGKPSAFRRTGSVIASDPRVAPDVSDGLPVRQRRQDHWRPREPRRPQRRRPRRRGG